MKKYFSQLRPLERRLAVGVLVVVIVLLNWWKVWPHFSDWNNLRHRLEAARQKSKLYEEAIGQIPEYEAKVKVFEGQGEYIPPDDQAITFTRTIQAQSSASGVGIVNTSPQMTRTNDAFFVEQVLNLSVLATDAQLVDFLYKLGSGASMTRVRDLELQPDAAHMHLTANIRLVASYQKSPAAPANANRTPAKSK